MHLEPTMPGKEKTQGDIQFLVARAETALGFRWQTLTLYVIGRCSLASGTEENAH
jgi:hypothetical protein